MKLLLRLSALVAVLLITGAGAALADAPMRLAGPVTDRAGVLGTAGSARVKEAVAQLKQVDLQTHVCSRLKGKGRHRRHVSPITLRKELQGCMELGRASRATDWLVSR